MQPTQDGAGLVDVGEVLRGGVAVTALTSSCVMGALLARLLDNRTATCDLDAVVARLVTDATPG